MKSRIISLGGFLAGPVLLYLIPFSVDQIDTGRIFLAWPNGSIWSNMFASLWWLLIAGWCTWYFRDHVGKRLTAWLAKHHPSHQLIQDVKTQLDEVRDHAEAARRIAADTYRNTNGGTDHPLALMAETRSEAVQAAGPIPSEPNA